MEIQFDVPPRQPYEPNATKHQKNRIWKLGYKNQEVMDNLGRDQAEFIIRKIHTEYERLNKVNSARRALILSAICLAIGVIGLPFAEPGSDLLLLILAMSGGFFTAIFGVKFLLIKASFLMKNRNS